MKNTQVTVVKSNRIIEASYTLTNNEQKVLLVALSQIDSRMPLSVEQGFEVSVNDLIKLSDFETKNEYRDLKAAAEQLLRRIVTINNPFINEKKVTQLKTHWVSSIAYIPNEGKVRLFFALHLLPYISQLTSEFTKFFLQEVGKFSSIYSFRLFELIQQWKNIGRLEIEIDLLRNRFELNGKYTAIKDFKKYVIDPAIKDINTHSNYSVQWQQRKTGRKVTHLIFTFAEKQPETPEEKPQEIKPKPKAAITLTEEQQACFDWAKNQPHWQKFTKNKKSFLTCFNNTVEGGLKDQWLETLPKSAQPKPEKSEPTAAQLKNQRKVEISNLRNAIKQMEGLNKSSPNPAITAQIEQLKQQLEEKMKS